MTKRLFICGDSFCSTDPDYSGSWVEYLQTLCPDTDIVNLSSPGASNYLIHLQVKHAVENDCDYLIYHATSSVRFEFSINHTEVEKENLYRYWNRSHNEADKSMICTSWLTPENSEFFDRKQSQQIKDFFTTFIDFSSQIYKNYLYIKSTLQLIETKKITNWVWSQGGFEHDSFNPVMEWDFSDYRDKESIYNLWDYYDPQKLRPYYHVEDPELIKNICTYYKNRLQLSV
jgi:hypothetical protein